MEWLQVQDAIFPESAIVRVHHLAASEGVKETVTVTLSDGKVVAAFDGEAADLWSYFERKVVKRGTATGEWEAGERRIR